jgi:hypothetical protein
MVFGLQVLGPSCRLDLLASIINVNEKKMDNIVFKWTRDISRQLFT